MVNIKVYATTVVALHICRYSSYELEVTCFSQNIDIDNLIIL